MEEDRKSSEDNVVEFIDAHYFEMEDMDYWIERNKEICTRWQEEKEFVMQLQDDVAIRDVFGVVINQKEGERNVWFSSGIMTVNRAFKNRFNIVCELVREAKNATELSKNDELLDGVVKELEHLMIMMRKFQNEEGDFRFCYERTQSILREFVKWRADPGKETVAVATQADDEEVSNLKTSV